jgi:hypothetical protein
MRDKLDLNHSLFGIHFQGNAGVIDSLGFLSLNSTSDLPLQQSKKNIDGVSSMSMREICKAKIQYTYDANTRTIAMPEQPHNLTTRTDKCWICESWVETTINLDLNSLRIPYTIPANPNEPIAVYVHFDFDDYQPQPMVDLRIGSKSDRQGKF